MASTIGVNELQQNASKYVHEAEQGAEFEITSQGRPTGVTLSRAPQPPRGISLEELKNSSMWKTPITPERRQKLLEYIEQGREEAGYIGDRRGNS